MRRKFVLILLVGFAVLLQRCDDDESPCGTYRLTTQIDVQDREGGDAIFSYNANGSLQRVSGRYLAEDNLFYDASGRLIKVEQNSEAMPQIVLLFDYDAKGRVIAIYEDAHYLDSTVFEYDDSDRMIKAIFYLTKTEIFYYYDIEYPDEATVKNSIFYRDQDTKDFELGYVYTYTMDSRPRPHPKEYYLYRFPYEEVFLPHNPLSIHSTYGGGTVTTKSYTYDLRGYPLSEDDKFTYVYSCE